MQRNSRLAKKLGEVLQYEIPHFTRWGLVAILALVIVLLIILPTEPFLLSHKIWIDVFIAIGTIGAVAVALFLARWGEHYRKKPKISIKPVRIINNEQRYSDGRALKIYRLVLENNSEDLIKIVHCNLEKIEELSNGDFAPRKNFISVPLPWTHYGNFGPNRDIAVGEFAYLDIVQIVGDNQFYKICWPKWLGEPYEPDFVQLAFGSQYILHIAFYTEKLIKNVMIRVTNSAVTLENSI